MHNLLLNIKKQGVRALKSSFNKQDDISRHWKTLIDKMLGD